MIFSVREAVRVQAAAETGKTKHSRYSHLHITAHKSVKKSIHFRDLIIPDDDKTIGQVSPSHHSEATGRERGVGWGREGERGECGRASSGGGVDVHDDA